MNKFASTITLLLGIVSFGFTRKALALTACIDERPWIPYTNPDPARPGTMQTLVDAAARELGISLEIVALPWRRCLESIRAGRIAAMIGGGDVAFIRKFAEFPMTGALTDSSRSLGSARILLVRRKDSPANWNGVTFEGLERPVGVAMGTQVMIDTVTKHGWLADDGGKTDEQNLRKLLQNRVDLMAGYEFDLSPLIEKSFKGKVQVLPVPLIETDYYLAFSKVYYESNTAAVESIWDKIRTIRGSHFFNMKSLLLDNISSSLPISSR